MTKIFVAGHKGMVGSAICRQLHNQDVELVTASRHELDLTNQVQVKDFFSTHKFNEVYLAAAKVGGIHANNTYPADFIYQNLMIQNNIIHQSYKSGVKKLLFLGSSCIYPRLAKQPMNEEQLLSGYLEPTNEPYAVAKIAGIKMCDSYNRQYGLDYRSVMPTNLYGPGDNYHPQNSHVIPALLRRFHEAKFQNRENVIVWGSGSPYREFLYVDDMASACVFVMGLDKKDFFRSKTDTVTHVNVGTGQEISLKTLSEMIANTTGFTGRVEWDRTKPDGAPRKLMDCNKLTLLGWKSSTSLSDGLKKAYDWYLSNH
jgi:GDP-L-fucose synthase